MGKGKIMTMEYSQVNRVEKLQPARAVGNVAIFPKINKVKKNVNILKVVKKCGQANSRPMLMDLFT